MPVKAPPVPLTDRVAADNKRARLDAAQRHVDTLKSSPNGRMAVRHLCHLFDAVDNLDQLEYTALASILAATWSPEGNSVRLMVRVAHGCAANSTNGPHERRCHDCGNVAIHADNIAPEVCCKKCGSQDTRWTRKAVG